MKIKFNEQEEESPLELVGGPNSPERRESRARQNFRNKATQWTNEVLYILKRMHRLTDRTNYAAAEGELQQVITAIRDEVERLQATFDNGGPVGFALREDYNMKIKKNGKVIRLTESDLKRIVKRVLSEQIIPDFPGGARNNAVENNEVENILFQCVEKAKDTLTDLETFYDVTHNLGVPFNPSGKKLKNAMSYISRMVKSYENQIPNYTLEDYERLLEDACGGYSDTVTTEISKGLKVAGEFYKRFKKEILENPNFKPGDERLVPKAKQLIHDNLEKIDNDLDNLKELSSELCQIKKDSDAEDGGGSGI